MLGIVFLAATATCGLLTSLRTSEMVDRVNEKFPTEKQFKPLGWHLSKQQNLWRSYKSWYPDGTLLNGKPGYALTANGQFTIFTGDGSSKLTTS
jgi:NADH:ubiquinone oxidoreductase subunit